MKSDRVHVQRWWTIAFLTIAAAMTLYFTVIDWRRADRPVTDTDPRGDFSFFYTASKAMTQGADIYTAKPADKDRPGYIYPPLIAFLYQPLTHLEVPWAARVSLLFNVTAVVLSLGFAARALVERLGRSVDWQIVLALAVIAAIPSADKIKGELQMFQTNALIMLGMTLGLYFLDRRPFWSGIALGFSMNVKYQALALLLYLILRRRWRAAGATVLGTLFWAFLPALSVGLTREAGYLVRGFSGVLRLAGLNLGPDVANVEPISSGFSVSFTSAAARFSERFAPAISPFLISGVLAVIWLALLALFMRAHRLPVLAWPPERMQREVPWRGVAGIEFIAVIASVLTFSPQTNMRHMVLTSLVYVLGVVVAFEARGKTRWTAIAGLIILWMGLSLPPGHRVGGIVTGSVAIWHQIGGPTLSLLLATGIIAWAGLSVATSAPVQTSQVPVDSPAPGLAPHL